MNKEEFILELSKRLEYSNDKCILINDVLENNFFISRKNKDKIVDDLILKLGIDYDEAAHIYDVAVMIIKEEVGNKLKYPFKSLD